jgi:uncharacterized Ntn-hydrolase superfamily protein
MIRLAWESAMRYLYLAIFALGLTGIGLTASVTEPATDRAVCANTFSIVAYDPDSKEWGVATASRVLAVGASVPYAKANAGAVASQSYVNPTFGPKGLELLAAGKSAEETLKSLTDADPGKELRQVGIVDAKGNVAMFNGKKCSSWFGGKEGKHFVCLGNLLASEKVVEDMAKTYEEKKGPLAWRLVWAMEAGDKAGGDKRGKQSAGIVVAREGAGANGFGDRYIDLRVDDHEMPIQELQRILAKQIRKPKEDK